MTLVDKIAAHLMNEAKLTPVQQLQKDMMKVRDIRVNEVITLKAVDGTIKESQLMAALRKKQLTVNDIADGDYISLETLKKHNIIVS